MDFDGLVNYLTDGLDEESAKSVRTALANEKIKTRAGGMKLQSDLDAIEAKRSELARELEGDGPQKPGARAYREWAEKNGKKVQELAQLEQKVIAKYGTIEAAQSALEGADPVDDKQKQGSGGLSREEIAALVQSETDKRIREGYSPRWSSLLTGVGSIVQKHMFAGRKSPIDMKKLEEIAGKYNGDLDLAYDEYDKPEREVEAKAATEKEIDRRVKEQIQKQGYTHMPGGADATPGTLSIHRNSEKFDKAKMEQDLVNTFVSGSYDGKTGDGKNSGFFN